MYFNLSFKVPRSEGFSSQCCWQNSELYLIWPHHGDFRLIFSSKQQRSNYGLTAEYPATPKTHLESVATWLRGYGNTRLGS